MNEWTRAEAKANLYADLLREAGWRVNVSVYRTAASRLTTGKVLSPGTVHAVMVAVRDHNEDALTLSWISVVDGARRTTRRKTARTGRLNAEAKDMRKLRTQAEVMAHIDQMLMMEAA